ncbi:hypothetical protein [Zhouia amylolytica]|uniref:Long-chain fatty acid transport protein n=1 Tax=Zhouia amylolytica AD3 TaxID=1286632 RepID=W2UL59_9FLAO|nr:hypothetical protein [Zhouia amylolytica]ETN94176.1 hypothetical protein P278_29800 [Zhouia amylolytica AD3]
MKSCSKLITILVFFSNLIVYSQDTHYWSQQFGTESALMSGAVIGGANDNTMLFYNPGALGFLDNTSISVNANAYRIENISIANALGEKASFNSKQLGSVPLLAGGMIDTKNEDWKIAYGFMAPVNFDFKAIARRDGNFDIIANDESPGLEELFGESSITNKLSEILVAFGVAHRFNDNWSFGVSNLITARSHTFNRNYSAYVFMNDANSTLVGGNLSQNIDYYNVRYAAKLGLSYQKGNWKTGLTITTPSISFMGIGTVASNIAARNLKLIDDERISGVATDRQAELKTTYKSPFSISGGVNYNKDKSKIGIAFQYYASIDVYDIMDVAPNTFVRPASLAPELTSDYFMRAQAAAKDVFNIAVGYEYMLKNDLSLYLSGRSDLTYFDKRLNESNGIKATISDWNLYHFASGITLKKQKSQLSLGLLYSTGVTNNYEQKGSLNNPAEGNLLQGSRTITKASYNSLGFLLGYTFYFKKFELQND